MQENNNNTANSNTVNNNNVPEYKYDSTTKTSFMKVPGSSEFVLLPVSTIKYKKHSSVNMKNCPVYGTNFNRTETITQEQRIAKSKIEYFYNDIDNTRTVICHARNSVDKYKNNKLHSDFGPACYGSGVAEMWYQNGILHRENGPAIIYPSGLMEWYVNGIWIKSEKQPKRSKK